MFGVIVVVAGTSKGNKTLAEMSQREPGNVAAVLVGDFSLV
jgi:hypothetical protein